jgi:hypothetical protein
MTFIASKVFNTLRLAAVPLATHIGDSERTQLPNFALQRLKTNRRTSRGGPAAENGL